MTAFVLKLIAIAAMLLDHVAFIFVPMSSPLFFPMRIVGRLTMPIMCFFAAEGVRKTRNIKKYLLRLFVFALLSELPFRLAFQHELSQIWMPTNVIFTLFFSVLALALGNFLEEKTGKPLLRLVPYIGICLLLGKLHTDYFWFGALLVFAFYHAKESKNKRLFFLFITYGLFIGWEVFAGALSDPNPRLGFANGLLTGFLQLPGLCSLLFLNRYNGQKGRTKGVRYLFYLFYPLHLLALYLITLIL